jgi:hypothetical protein
LQVVEFWKLFLMLEQDTHADPSGALISLSGERCYSFYPPTFTRTKNSKISIYFHFIEVSSQFSLFSALSHWWFLNDFQFLDVFLERFLFIQIAQMQRFNELNEPKSKYAMRRILKSELSSPHPNCNLCTCEPCWQLHFYKSCITFLLGLLHGLEQYVDLVWVLSLKLACTVMLYSSSFFNV